MQRWKHGKIRNITGTRTDAIYFETHTDSSRIFGGIRIFKTLRIKWHFINIVTCIPIDRQQLGKNIPAKRTRETEGRPLLGNWLEDTLP
jgi:hypothetical protein